MPKEGGFVETPNKGKTRDRSLSRDTARDFRSLFEDVSKSEIDSLINDIIREYDLPYREVFNLLSTRKLENGISVPVSIFQDKRLTLLETLVKFLKEVHALSLPEVAVILSRRPKAVSRIYRNCMEKCSYSFSQADVGLHVPLLLLADRKLSILESLIEFLKEDQRMRYTDIARLIGRDHRTVWTAYKRAKEKRFDDGP